MQQRKSAIVTGSATGVGAATALMLAQRGYDVLINYSKSEREARQAHQRDRDDHSLDDAAHSRATSCTRQGLLLSDT